MTTNLFEGKIATTYATKPKSDKGTEQRLFARPDLFSKLDLSLLTKKETQDCYGSHPKLLGKAESLIVLADGRECVVEE